MTKRGLGRGLSALIPGASEEDTPALSTDLEVARLAPNPFQPRRVVEGPEFEQLVSSVRRHGILQPVVARPVAGGYEIVAGERRWRAAKLAGLTRIPAILKDVTDREMLELALIENLSREDLDPIERASAYRRLIDEFHMTQEQIVEVVGGSRPAVANTIRLLELPGEVQAAISQGRLSEGHGRALLGAQDQPRLLVELWRVVEQNGLSVRETEDLVKARLRNVSRETPHRRAPGQDPILLDLAARLREKYTTSVTIVPNGKKGTIHLSYYSQDDLERLIDLLLR